MMVYNEPKIQFTGLTEIEKRTEMDYNLDEIIQELLDLKKQIHDHPKQKEHQLSEFKKRYPYTSKDEALISLLNDPECSIEIIARLLIHECSGVRFSSSFYKILDHLL